MKIDTSKLKHKVNKKDGVIEAQCPACADAGHDNTGNHLIVYSDGRFGCVVNTGDAEHNKEILKLVGVESEEDIPPAKVIVRPFPGAPSRSLMKVPRRSLEELGLKREDI